MQLFCLLCVRSFVEGGQQKKRLIPNAAHHLQVDVQSEICKKLSLLTRIFKRITQTKLHYLMYGHDLTGGLKAFPELEKHLFANADVVPFLHFVNAIVKIQR